MTLPSLFSCRHAQIGWRQWRDAQGKPWHSCLTCGAPVAARIDLTPAERFNTPPYTPKLTEPKGDLL